MQLFDHVDKFSVYGSKTQTKTLYSTYFLAEKLQNSCPNSQVFHKLRMVGFVQTNPNTPAAHQATECRDVVRIFRRCHPQIIAT